MKNLWKEILWSFFQIPTSQNGKCFLHNISKLLTNPSSQYENIMMLGYFNLTMENLALGKNPSGKSPPRLPPIPLPPPLGKNCPGKFTPGKKFPRNKFPEDRIIGKNPPGKNPPIVSFFVLFFRCLSCFRFFYVIFKILLHSKLIFSLIIINLATLCNCVIK